MKSVKLNYSCLPELLLGTVSICLKTGLWYVRILAHFIFFISWWDFCGLLKFMRIFYIFL